MTSATPETADAPCSTPSPRRRPTRALAPAPALALLALCLAYAAYMPSAWMRPRQAAAPPLPLPSPAPERTEPDAQAEADTRLRRAVETAQARVDQATAQLATLKARVDSAGDLDGLQQAAGQVQQELEQAVRLRQANRELLQTLQAALADPAPLAAPAIHALGAQHAVCRLREALTAAESDTANLLRTMLPGHPRVQASTAKEQEIRRQLHDALDAAIRDVQAEQVRLDAQCDMLSRKSAQAQELVQQLAATHADYANQTALVARHARALEQARDQLDLAHDDQAASPAPNAADSAERTAAVPAAPPAKGPTPTLLWAAAIVGGLSVSLGLFSLRRGSIARTGGAPPDPRPTRHVPAPPARQPAPRVAPSPAGPGNSTGMTLRQALERCAAKRRGE